MPPEPRRIGAPPKSRSRPILVACVILVACAIIVACVIFGGDDQLILDVLLLLLLLKDELPALIKNMTCRAEMYFQFKILYKLQRSRIVAKKLGRARLCEHKFQF